MSNTYKTPLFLPTVLILFVVCAACHNYYKVAGGPAAGRSVNASRIDNLNDQARYFILRSGNKSWNMKTLALSSDQKSLSCQLDTVSYLHKLHFKLGRRRNMQYKKHRIEENQVLNEVHLFIPPDTAITSGSYTLALDKVQKIEVIEKDTKRTTGSYVIGAIGYTLGSIAVIGIIVAATKSSCPFVSAYDGNEFSLQGEIYGGSIYPQLARHDYMPLKMAPRPDGTLQVKISNELQERQYTDMADLWFISHDKDTKVLSDEQGNLYSITDPQLPVSARLNDNKDVLKSVMKAGDYELLYMDDSSRSDARNEVVLKFDKPEGVSKAKLLLILKNSYWLDLLYGELAKGFGTYYATYMKEQKTKPAAELLKWVKDQQIPLEVSVKTTRGWQRVTDITTIGPLATREIVVPVELPANDEAMTEIKLSAGFMFWEIDYAAIDFSDNNNFSVEKLSPKKATDEKRKNVLSQLMNEDGQYLDQPEIGNVATIIYKPANYSPLSKAYTYILHTKGYYEHIRDFKNKPDAGFLGQFRHPNAFPVYGMNLYKKVSAESLQSLAATQGSVK